MKLNTLVRVFLFAAATAAWMFLSTRPDSPQMAQGQESSDATAERPRLSPVPEPVSEDDSTDGEQGEAGDGLARRYPPRALKYLKTVEAAFGDPPGMTRLDPYGRVWVDRNKKRVVVDGYVVLNAGQLEMFACLPGTKEHESIVAVFTKAVVIHAGLLAIGAKQGHPVQWEPEFQPPTGSEIQIFVLWKDKDGKKRYTDARNWIRHVGSRDKTLESNWVFAGSSFWQDPDTGKEIYLAESGDLICVSNFSTAVLDVPFESSQVNAGLLFAAFTERIPEPGTPVRLVLQLVEKSTAAEHKAKPADGGELPPSSPTDTDDQHDLDSPKQPPSGNDAKAPAQPQPAGDTQ